MWKIEVTDTFAEEANYCWVKRGEFSMPPDPKNKRTFKASRNYMIAQVRDVAGWPTSVRVKVEDYGDSLTIRPRGLLQVAFVTWQDDQET